MSKHDYIPRRIETFHTWQESFISVLAEKAEALRIHPEDVEALWQEKEAYEEAYLLASEPMDTTSALRLERNRRTEVYQRKIRSFVNEHLRYNSRASDADKKLMGLNVPDRIATAPATPLTSPDVWVKADGNQQHWLRFREGGSLMKARPKGMLGCEIWYKKGGDEPLGDEGWEYVATATSTPYKVVFEMNELGLRVYYRLRWINTRGKHGPWSTLVSAIIA